MSDRALKYRRLHNILLIQKNLALRAGSSPLTLLLDSVEQSAKPLLKRYIHNAKISKIDAIFISYETLSSPAGIKHFIKARRKDSATILKEVTAATIPSNRTLIIIDTLPTLTTTNLPTFLSTLLQSPSTIILLVHHTDIPLPPQPNLNIYAPAPLPLLRYLATTIFTLHSLPQTIARKRATDRSMAEPSFGLGEEREGVIVGMGANAATAFPTRGAITTEWTGLVLAAEFRRKSGKAVEEWFFVPASWDDGLQAKPMLLDDYPGYNLRGHVSGNGLDGQGLGNGITAMDGGGGGGVRGVGAAGVDDERYASTFELGLTEKQRRDREGVVLPYFDAQKSVLGEVGEGGRILYEFGVEDDFDEEEDEI